MDLLAQPESNLNPEIWWFALSPLLTLVGGALFLLVVGALTPKWPKGLYAFVTATIAGAAGVSLELSSPGVGTVKNRPSPAVSNP